MILIAHRGNIIGPDLSRENHPDYIKQALDLGYHVEIDVWKIGEKFVLGHDEPRYEIEWDFFYEEQYSMWWHAKNLDALSAMLNWGVYQGIVNCFWHENDKFTVTSKGFIWTYPKMKTCEHSIIVCEDEAQTMHMSTQNIFGICSDYVGKIK